MALRSAAAAIATAAAACWLANTTTAAAEVDPLLYPETKLTASDGALNDFFGHSVAVSGDTLAIGAFQDDAAGTDSGSVYVFERRGAQHFELPKLIGSDTMAGDAFGKFVAVDGDTLLVGAPQHGGSGAAYVFVREGAVWREQARLTASDAAAGDRFGSFVAIEGETAVVGATLADAGVADSGAAYVFVRDGTTWMQQAKLVASDAAAGDQFGFCVAIQAETAVIGSPYDDDLLSDSGSAYVFVRNGASWSQQAKLTAPDPGLGDNFGESVSVHLDTLAVSGRRNDDIGSNSGSAYVFGRNGAAWSVQAKLIGSDTESMDNFGISVSLEGDVLLIGAAGDDDFGFNSGAAYVFERIAGSWSEQLKITASDAASTDGFGATVSLDGDSLLVSSSLDDDLGDFSGSAYLYSYAPSVTVRLEEIGGQHVFDIVLGNGTMTSRDFELAIWIECPAIGFLGSVTGVPAPLITLPPIAAFEAIADVPIPASLPFPGTTVGARLVDPVTKRVLSESICSTLPCN